MKYFAYIFALLVIQLSLTAQDTTQNFQKDFSIEFGIAFNKPAGKYAFQTGNNNQGFAQNGVFANFAAKQLINNFTAVKFSVAAMINPVNPEYFHLDIYAPNVYVAIGKWLNLNISVGPVFFIVADNSIFEFYIAPCLLNATSPYVNYSKSEDGFIVYQNNYEKGSGLSLGINPEIALLQNLGNNKQFKIFASYIYSKTNIEYENRIYYKNENEEFVWVTHEKNRIVNIEAINIGIGIIF